MNRQIRHNYFTFFIIHGILRFSSFIWLWEFNDLYSSMFWLMTSFIPLLICLIYVIYVYYDINVSWRFKK